MRFRAQLPGALAAVVLAANSPAGWAGDPSERTLIYRLRGEVRPFFFWIGRKDVGGGRITIRKTCSSPFRWSEEIEVLFGSHPERIPGRINRWGFGRETADWIRDSDAGTPRLLATQFRGFMSHSAESSIDEVIPEARGGGRTHTFDVNRSVVSPEWARHELRVFTDGEEFNFRHSAHYLAKYRTCLARAPVLHAEELSNGHRAYAEPFGFLTALSPDGAGGACLCDIAANSLLVSWLITMWALTIERLYRMRYLHRGRHPIRTAIELVDCLWLSLSRPYQPDTG